MKLANTEQMRLIDKTTIEEYGIDGIVLMENVGAEIAREALKTDADSFAVVCGKGNNGGDGFVAARWLYNAGKKVEVLIACNEDEIKAEALANYNILKKLGVKIFECSRENILSADVVVDALVGTGVKGALTGKIADAVSLINENAKFVISADLPSGVSADTGEVFGECVRADITVTAGVAKIGLYCYPSAEYAGAVKVCNASFPQKVIDEAGIDVETIDEIKLPKRHTNSHKGTFGKVLTICGSKKYAGAAVLSSTSAIKSGCGIVSMAIPEDIYNVSRTPELIAIPLKSNNGMISFDAYEEISDSVSKSDAVLIGCGLGNSDDISKITKKVISECKAPLVIDADGINSICKDIDMLKHKKCDIILTPHIGEFARITGYDTEFIMNNTVTLTKHFAKEYNVVLVLKCARTVIAFPDGKTFICTNGNSGMATAGSGDVLAGVITSFLAQGMSVKDAALRGVYIHSFAGELAKEKRGEYGMTAFDVLENIPEAIDENINTERIK